MGKFHHREMRSISAEGDGGPSSVQGFELLVSGLKPQCMHRISVVVRCCVENLPEPDWQRLKRLDLYSFEDLDSCRPPKLKRWIYYDL